MKNETNDASREIKTGGNLSDLARLEKFRKGIEAIPITRVNNSYLYLVDVLLPAIEKTKGLSDNYKKLSEVATNLQWALVVFDRLEYLQAALHREKALCKFLNEKAGELEKELQKYTTLEDLAMSQSLDTYRAAIVARLTNSTNFKP
jgi:ABC-type uncharacterized transport system fused permease/ATPase subunit